MALEAWLWVSGFAAVWTVWGFVVGVGARAAASAFRARGGSW